MPGIKPFQALYYNKDKVKDFALVVSPPYDVISTDRQQELHNLSPYNFTHLDLAKDQPEDTPEDNKYTRAQQTFEKWIADEILLQDDGPAIYFYKQEFKILGERHSRLGFIALLELGSEEDSKVYPHENTHQDAVDDRFELTKALQANLSSIFVCYADQQRKVEKIFTKHVLSTEPLINVVDENDVRNKLWSFKNPGLINEIHDSLADQNLFIADGHHRFQMANQYRALRAADTPNATGKEPWNYVMTYFANLDSKDLQIFPYHRVIRKVSKKMDFIDEYFRTDKVKNSNELQILLARAGLNEHAFGLYTRDGIKLLRLKNRLLINEFIKKGSQELKSLDANILKYFILDKLGVKSDDIAYRKDIQEVTSMVDDSSADVGFILNAVKIPQLKSIALNGEKMPPKTTYFYPKVMSGLAVYRMD